MRHRRLSIFFWLLIVAASLMAMLMTSASQRSRAAAGAPVLLTQAGTTRGLAMESVTRIAEPIPGANAGSIRDRCTHARNVDDDESDARPERVTRAVTADAEDGAHAHYPLLVEDVRRSRVNPG
jgi:hypothetical protein